MDHLTVGQPCYVEEPAWSFFGIKFGKVEFGGVVEELGPEVALVRLHSGEPYEVDCKKIKKERLFIGEPCMVLVGGNRASGVILDFLDISLVVVKLDTGEIVRVLRTDVKAQSRFE